MIQHGVVLFYTTSAVMRAEKLLKKEGYSIKLIPTPRQFSSDCGIALEFDWNYLDRIKPVLDKVKVDIDAIHLLDAKET